MADTALPRKTFFSGIALPAFSWGLPFHSLMVAVAFGAIRFQADTVRMLAAWKEIGVLGLIVFVVLRAMTGEVAGVAFTGMVLGVLYGRSLAVAFWVGGEIWLCGGVLPGGFVCGMRSSWSGVPLCFGVRAAEVTVDGAGPLRRVCSFG